MKIDKIFSFLVPKDRKFFPLFVEAADILVSASELLAKLVREGDLALRQELIREIKEAEHLGDAITRRLIFELNGTFITPFDREDIHDLINTMDDIVDHIYAASKRMHHYKLTLFPEEFVWISDCLLVSTKEIHHILSHVHSIGDFKMHLESCKNIREMESKVDDIYQEFLAKLFEEEANAIDLIKKRDILTTLEKAIDKCDDVSNIFSTLIVKMS